MTKPIYISSCVHVSVRTPLSLIKAVNANSAVENFRRQIHNLSLDSWYKVALKNLPYSQRPEVKRTLQFRMKYGRINGNSPRPNKRGKRGRHDIFGEKSIFMLCCFVGVSTFVYA